jgi:hypothetical protein
LIPPWAPGLHAASFDKVIPQDMLTCSAEKVSQTRKRDAVAALLLLATLN